MKLRQTNKQVLVFAEQCCQRGAVLGFAQDHLDEKRSDDFSIWTRSQATSLLTAVQNGAKVSHFQIQCAKNVIGYTD